ncbi:AP-3 complex subunit sigma [Kipferlia bialata]|uniref:AP-3 complex subunit sigma n=1 Tax=Kipferlia bialata TaxID=797122 RepID=A0A9K3D580_9EUKA|nr:AP-3 complex subunit sigma [Kipferlia bialata]|eukprot:g10475.t1
MLDLIQNFVECLDRCFENVCELDLIFNVDVVNAVLDEIIQGGIVFETSNKDILAAFNSARTRARASA